MSYSTHSTSLITIPLTLRYHHHANQFRQQHAASKAKQVFLNELVIQAVADYLRCMSINVDMVSSESCNLPLQALSESSSLLLPGQGILECRPVLPDAETCWVPLETWGDRLGYIAVQVNAELTEARLVGFLPSVEEEQVALCNFQPIEGLFDVLEAPAEIEQAVQSVQQNITQLGQWLHSVVTSGWQTLDELISVPPSALSFRAAESSEIWAMRGKIVTLPTPPLLSERYFLDVDTPDTKMALFIGVLPITETEVEVWVRACPLAPSAYLPHNLLIQILDDQGVSVMQAQVRQTDMIQLRFQGFYGESFGLRLSLDDWLVTEAFVI
jgi:hypothetical protein